MRLARLGALALCLTLAALVGRGVAREDKKETPKEPARTEQVKLTQEEIDQIDALKKTDLLQMVSRAQNSLSRSGQVLLKQRIRLLSIQQKADAIIANLRNDPDVAAAARLRESDEARKRLAELAKIEDTKKLETEFVKFLQEQKVSAAALVKFREYQGAQAASEKCKEGLQKIEARLSRPGTPVAGPDPLLVSGQSLDKQAGAILDGLAGKEEPSDRSEAGRTPPTDVRELLKALLK
jgi:hypothetical protein